jgi:hypothetical protein
MITSIALFWALLILLLQTSWGKELFTNYIVQLAKKNNIDLTIQETKGLFPLEYTFSKVDLKISDEIKISIDKLQVEFALLPLLIRQISVQNLIAEKIHIQQIAPLAASKLNGETKAFSTLPSLRLQFKSFYLKEIFLPGLENMPLSCKGKAGFRKSRFSFHCSIKKPHFEKSFLDFRLRGHKKENLVHGKFYIQTEDLDNFIEKLPINASFDGKIAAKMTYDDFFDSITHFKWPRLQEGKIDGMVYKFYGRKAEFLNTPFFANFFASGNFSSDTAGTFNLESLILKNSSLALSMQATFAKEKFQKLSVRYYTLQLSNQTLIPHPIYGSLEGIFNLNDKNEFVATLNSNLLQMDHLTVKNLQTKFQGSLSQNNIQGECDSNFELMGEKIKAISSFATMQDWKELALSNIKITNPSFSIKSSLTVSSPLIVKGNIQADWENLHLLKYILKDFDLDAIGGLTCDLSYDEKAKVQLLHSTITLHQVQFLDIVTKHAQLIADVKDPFFNPKGEITLSANHANYGHLTLENIALKTANFLEKNPFELSLKGELKDPFLLSITGSWSQPKDHLIINLNDLTGNLFTHNLKCKNVSLEWGKEFFHVGDFDLYLADYLLKGKIHLEKKLADIRFFSTRFPLDFLSLNSYHLTARGFGSLNGFLTYKNNVLESDAQIQIENLSATSIGYEKPFTLQGSIQAHLEGKSLKANAKIQFKDSQMLKWESLIPVHLSFYPFDISLEKKEPFSLNSSFTGKVQEILDFIDLGTHRLEGDIESNIKAGGSFLNPHVTGFIKWKNGSYENYFTGTHLINIQSEITADQTSLTLLPTQGTDTQKGSFTASGKMEILPLRKFPYSLEVAFNDLICLETDLAYVKANGKLALKGNSEKADAQGQITIAQADINIPDKIPQTPVVLPIKMMGSVKKEPTKSSLPALSLYPILLNLNIDAPENFKIQGQGVISQWTGHLKLGGTLDNMLIKGSLDLAKGDLLFAGHYFDLTGGEVIFSGKEKEPPTIAVSGKTTIRGTNIIANLKGPLNIPQLTFSSSPAMPLSSILSLILFGQELSEITGIQAVQLASNIATLSTEQPSIIETTKKKLGIDRLSIVSTPAVNVDEPEKMAIQVGKYVTKGILVTFSQGLDQASDNLIVEVDLSKGFIFQIETQPEEAEQAKFTVKWNYNY